MIKIIGIIFVLIVWSFIITGTFNLISPWSTFRWAIE